MTAYEGRRRSFVKSGKKSLFRLLLGKMGIVVLLLLLQFVALFWIFVRFEQFLPHIYGRTAIFTVLMVLHIINSTQDPTAKITWLVLIMLLPVFGGLLYLFTEREWGHRAMKKRLSDLRKHTIETMPVREEGILALEQTAPGAAAMCRYVASTGYFPVYRNTEVTYFPLGEDKFQALLQELAQAKQYIFLEYFIIEEGHMWGSVLDILAQKAKQGLDVRVMYDGTCEFTKLSRGYCKRLQKLGISCKVFSRVVPIVSTHYNYRDHRKIVVIDGHTAFTGGVNLADEYINQIHPYGHWKDTAVMLRGEAAKSFEMMFLQNWNLDERHVALQPISTQPTVQTDEVGFVMPYGDSPLDGHKVGRRVYMDLLNRASRYVHIMTPYLILDGELESAIRYVAQRGVEVSIILPGIPDQVIPHALAQSHYRALLAAGVHVYEYTPGFVHAKVMVCDDAEAVVGTINMDYRSLYHHFECAAYLNRIKAIGEIEEDFQKTLKSCKKVDMEFIKKQKWHMKLMGYLLKIIAPLL